MKIELEYRPEMIDYKVTIENNCSFHSDPIEAIKLALEGHNYNVHQEMYKLLKDIDKVIKRYESK